MTQPPLLTESRARAPSPSPNSHLSPAPSPQLSPSQLQHCCQQRQLRPLPRALCNRHGGAAGASAQVPGSWRSVPPLSPPSSPNPGALSVWAPEPGCSAACGDSAKSSAVPQQPQDEAEMPGLSSEGARRAQRPPVQGTAPSGVGPQAGAAAGDPPSTPAWRPEPPQCSRLRAPCRLGGAR